MVRTGRRVWIVGCLVAAGLALAGCSPKQTATEPSIRADPTHSHRVQAAADAADAAVAVASATDEPISVPEGLLTRPQSASIFVGRTKAEVRAAFGPPSNVITAGGSDTWFHNGNLSIVDPDAGVTLRKVGVDLGVDGRVSHII